MVITQRIWKSILFFIKKGLQLTTSEDFIAKEEAFKV